MTVPRLLVLGVGRSGTGYAASLLRSFGLAFGHEAVYDWQADSGSAQRWEGFDGDSSLTAWAGIEHLDRPCKVAVVLRDPRLVVASLLGSYFFADECPCHEPGEHKTAPYRLWMADRFPDIEREATEIGRAACYVASALQAIVGACNHPNVIGITTWDIAELADDGCVYEFAKFFGAVPTLGQVRHAVASAERNDHRRDPARAELLDALLDSDWTV